MKNLKTVAVVTLIGLCLSFQTLGSGIKFENLSLKEGLEKAKKENKQVFIDIYATWCAPCKYLSSSVFADDELGDFMNKHFINLKLDGEKEDGELLMNDFELNSYPTMLFLSPEKDLLKKIVGAVDPDVILNRGNAIIFPESTELFKLTKDYENGNREREFLKEYIGVVYDEDLEFKKYVDEFLSLYPDVLLSDDNEFLIFCLGVDDLDHELMKEFLANANTHYSLHKDDTQIKMQAILFDLVDKAKVDKNTKVIIEGVEILFDPFCIIFGYDYTKQELIDLLIEYYHEE